MSDRPGRDSAPERRSAIDLLDLKYVFTQRPLLTAKRFIEEAAARGVELEIGHLEAAHKVGLLTPFFRADFDRQEVRRILKKNGAVGYPDFTLETLNELRSQGQLFTPETESFRPWANDLVRVGNRSEAASVYLYSPWQLLKLVEFRMELRGFRRTSRTWKESKFRAPTPSAFCVLPMHQWVFVVLSALEPKYLPGVVLTVKGTSGPASDKWFEDYGSWRDGARPEDLSSWLRLTPDQTSNAADALSSRTRFFDPLRQWTDLVRLMSPDKWEQLKGDARLAIDHRLAAELLYRLRDDLSEVGAAPPLAELTSFAWHPRLDRWNRPSAALDRVLTDFGLSPDPSLVWALEGQVEVLMAGRTMDYLNVPNYRSFIHLFDIGGNDKDYGLLAQFVAVPTTGQLLSHDFVLLERPVTRFLVSTDPENKLQTQTDRAAMRARIVSSIFNKLPKQYRTPPAREQIDQLVSVEAWSEDQSFEFAHFSDGDLVGAIRAAYLARDGQLVDIDPSEVAALRLRHGNLKALLNRLPSPAFAKDELVNLLWPYLKGQLDAAKDADNLDRIPLVRHLRIALELATKSFRRHTGMKV